MSNSAFDEVREELIKKNETEAFKAGLIDNIEITWLNSVMIFTLSDRLRAGTYVVPDADLAVIDLRSLFSLLHYCPDDTRYLKRLGEIFAELTTSKEEVVNFKDILTHRSPTLAEIEVLKPYLLIATAKSFRAFSLVCEHKDALSEIRKLRKRKSKTHQPVKPAKSKKVDLINNAISSNNPKVLEAVNLSCLGVSAWNECKEDWFAASSLVKCHILRTPKKFWCDRELELKIALAEHLKDKLIQNNGHLYMNDFFGVKICFTKEDFEAFPRELQIVLVNARLKSTMSICIPTDGLEGLLMASVLVGSKERDLLNLRSLVAAKYLAFGDDVFIPEDLQKIPDGVVSLIKICRGLWDVKNLYDSLPELSAYRKHFVKIYATHNTCYTLDILGLPTRGVELFI